MSEPTRHPSASHDLLPPVGAESDSRDVAQKPNEQPLPSSEISLEAVVENVVEQAFIHMGSNADPILRHMTSDHVTKLMEIAAKDSERRFELERIRHQYIPKVTLFLVGACVLAVLLLCWMFLWFNKVESLAPILIPILTFITGLAGGAFAGYGYANRTSGNSK